MREEFPDVPIEVEVDRLDQIEPVLAEGADLILLDNFTVGETAEAVALVAGRSRLESSGGLTLQDAPALRGDRRGLPGGGRAHPLLARPGHRPRPA